MFEKIQNQNFPKTVWTLYFGSRVTFKLPTIIN